MAKLIDKPVLARSIFEAGGSALALLPQTKITSVMPYKGQHVAVGNALQKNLDLPWPALGRLCFGKHGKIAWAGRNQAFVFGVPANPRIASHAAFVDQSDGWVGLRLTGADRSEVMARLCPVDLQASAAIRANIQHVPALILVEDDAIEVYVFRSMAQTAWHDIEQAMRRVAARRQLAKKHRSEGIFLG